MPRTEPSAGLAVFLDLRAPDLSAIRTLRMAPEGMATGVPATVRYLLVRDAEGVVDFHHEQGSGWISLGRPVRGDRLRVSYLAEPSFESGRLGLVVSAESVWGVGYGFLALPEVAGHLSVRLSWALDAIAAPTAASSWGVGPRISARATVGELHHALYLAGDLTIVEGADGHRLVSRGLPRFELREALAFCSRVLATARARFEPEDDEPVTFVLLPEAGLGSRNDGAALHRAFAVWFDATRPLDDRLRLLLAHEMLHRWIGGTLRFVGPDGQEARWFSEGFTVHLARSLLVHEGLIEPSHYLRDIYRDLQSQLAATLAENGRLSRRLATFVTAANQHHAAPEYARGALYAARLDAALGEAGLAGLDALLLPLLDRARERRAALGLSDWREALVEALGPQASEELDRLVLSQSEPVELPEQVLRPWLRMVAQYP